MHLTISRPLRPQPLRVRHVEADTEGGGPRRGRCARVTTERKRAANRVNARRSTGPRSTAGKARVASNALRHGLNVAVADDPLLTEDVERLARAMCDGVGRGGARSAPSAPVGRNKRKRIAPFRTQEAQCAALIAPYEL